MLKLISGLFKKANLPSSGMMAGTVINSPPPPKVKNKQQTLASYLRTATPNPDTQLLRNERNLATSDILDYRQGGDTRTIIRDFVRSSPDLSAAVTAYARTAITRKYKAVAKNLDGTFNSDATNILQQIITRMDVLSDYSLGFDDTYSLRSLSETFTRELLMYGGCSCELVLDKARLPDKIVPISTTQIRMYPTKDGTRRVPRQYLAGVFIDLDIPTFFQVNLDKDTLEAYPISPLEPAIQATLFSAEFMNDVRRIVKRAIHPRVVVTIDEEKFRKNIPQELMYDTEKLQAYMNNVISDIQSTVNDLNPEDALVVFDTLGIEVVDHGNTSLSDEYKVLEEMANSKLSTGSKVLPTVLGHSNGTSNTASAEVLLFIKNVEGAVWAKLNEIYSKVFTLAVRLMGQDVYVEFKYDEIDLRPASELEAFYAMKQSRILTQLSLGLITDEEACLDLTGHLPPNGYTPKTGTGFMPNTGAEPTGNGYNGASNSGSALNQNLNSDAPKNPKSQNGGKPGN